MSLRFIVGIFGSSPNYLPDTTCSSPGVYPRELFYLPEADINGGSNTEDDKCVDDVPLIDARPDFRALRSAD